MEDNHILRMCICINLRDAEVWGNYWNACEVELVQQQEEMVMIFFGLVMCEYRLLIILFPKSDN